MKIALLGDIGANLPALEAVLNHAKSHGVTQFYNVGNSLGFDIFPNETVQRLQFENVTSILGRFDQRVLKAKAKLDQLKTSNDPDQLILLNWIYDNLSVASLNYLNSLKQSSLFIVQKKRILLTNHPPKLKQQKTRKQLERASDLPSKPMADIIICSQQQFPYIKKINNIRLINTGAIGYAFDTEIWACYTTLHFVCGLILVSQYRIKYDVNRRQTKSWPVSMSKLMTYTAYSELTAETASQVSTMAESSGASILAVTKPAPDDYLQSIEQLLHNCLQCKYAIHHAKQVTRLALDLFDQLQSLHQLTEVERRLLQYGAMLHDIGWLNGQQGHHKVAFNIITHTAALPFIKRDRFIVALLALYHRKNIPTVHHLHYASLEPADRQIVSYLAAILRVADAFDNSHQALIESLCCHIDVKTIKIIYSARQPAVAESSAISDKGIYFEEVFGRKLVIEWKTP
jgi:response regulator RpfG family c-di-GMP phosphodiesterase